MPLTCLFWNAYRKDLRDLVADAAVLFEADIVILIEHEADNDATLRSLQGHDPSFFQPEYALPRFQLFARQTELDLQEVYADTGGRVSIRRLQCNATELLLVAIHFPSKVHWGTLDQTAEAVNLSQQIRAEEEKRGHRNTIVVGDFNMNPFEPGLIQANGFHAAMTAETARTGARRVQGREYPFFYNPMWNLLGDRTDGPPGTHYFRATGKHLSYDWNMFDQVLVRPDVLKSFQMDVEIPTIFGDAELRNQKGRPNREVASDHFPILFRLSPVS